MDKLSYEDWRAKIAVTVSDEVVSDMERLNRFDVLEEIEKIMQSDYQLYLNGGFDEVLKHNQMVADMQADPTVDPATIPPLKSF